MQEMSYEVKFLTPAFLGNAEQSGQWRTPPFKALLRQSGIEKDWQKAMENSLEETPMGQLIRLRNRFAHSNFSRRAAYLTQGWLAEIPEAALSAMLGHQFQQQTRGEEDKKTARTLGESIGKLATAVQTEGNHRQVEFEDCQISLRTRRFVENFLSVAEFLAREGRAGDE